MQIHADLITINCRKVLAGLDLIGAPYELVHVDCFKGEQKGEPYMAINPNASVPAMVDGDLVLWESNAILQYAADLVGNAARCPTDLRQRADVNRWLLWESSSWFPSCYVYLVENCVKPLLGGQPDATVLETNAAQFHKLADIALAAPMHLHGWQRLPLNEHPNLRRWLTESVEQLPSWQKTWVGEGFTTQQ